nr:reverse transcriptase domain-containing protein [Tanacetum cinerariifolium]
MPHECLAIIESKSKVHYSRNKPVLAKVSKNTSASGISTYVVELKDMVKALLLVKKSQNQAPVTVKIVEESYENNLNRGPVYQPLVFQPPAYQAPAYQAPAPQTQGVSKDDFSAYIKANDVVMRNMQTQGQNMPNQFTNMTELFTKFVNSNSGSTLSSGTLPSNTTANPRSDLKAITTRSGVSYDGPQIPPPPIFLYKVVENKPEATKDTITPPNNRNFDADPRVPLIFGRSFLKTRRALIDVLEGKLTLRVGKEAITFNLDQTSRYSANYSDMTAKRIDVIDMAYEEYSQEVLSFSNVIASGNLTPNYDPIVSTTSSTFTPLKNSDFLLEEVDAFLTLEEDPTSPKVDESYLNSEGDILLLEAFLNDDPSLPPPNQGNYLPEVRKELKIYEAKSNKSLIDEPLEVELKDLPPHLEYAFLESGDKLPFSIAKDLSMEENTALITVLKSHKGLRTSGPTSEKSKSQNPRCYQTRGWHVCIDCRKLNEATRNDHFSLPFMDQMLERLAGNQNYCFLNGFSGYFQIIIDPKDQGKPHSPAHTERLLTTAYLLGYAINQVMIKSSEGVYMARKPLTFLRLATMDPPGDTMAQITQPRRCLIQDSIGPSFTVMPKILSKITTFVNVKARFNKEMRCHKTPSKCVKFLMSGTAGDHRKVQLNELRDQAFKNSLIYKEKTKRLHDSKIKDNLFNIDDRVLLFNFRLKIFSSKMKSHWSGPFTISHVFPYGTVVLSQPDEPNFKVNGHILKHYFREDIPKMVVPDLQTFPKDH